MPATTTERPSSPLLSLPAWLTIAGLGTIISVWSGLVNSVVTEPYLDEFFHVGQAQKYIEGRYREWDPKITTPPGLYVLSTLLSRITGLSSLASLRALNATLLPCLVLLILDLDVQLGMGKLRRDDKATLKGRPRSVLSTFSAHQLHAALNACLFPVIFFFSALYYTDIASVVSVVLCWDYFLRVHEGGTPTLLQDLNTFLLGVVSLTFRQTNIFWVSIFPAAILLVSKLDVGLPGHAQEGGTLLDPPVRESHIDDYFFFIMSLQRRLIEAVYVTYKRNWAYFKLVRLLLPYLAILSAFAAFVVWNGGVVLGDKSNHIATLHITQMLYLWPYMMFFSFPLSYPYLLQGLFGLLATMPILGPLEYQLMFKRKKILPRPGLIIAFTLFAALIVYYNTIVHPFTLADNRHYTFYAFRLLTRNRTTKFLVIPLYYMGAWAIVQTLGAPASLVLDTDQGRSSPVPRASKVDPTEKAGPPPTQPLRLNHAVAGEGAPVSFVIIWLATSALQLITAPLVEPRYFILPWLMWRLRVPQASPSVLSERERKEREKLRAERGWAFALRQMLWDDHDHRLWLETLWFLAINVGTGYMFLYRGFEWVQEPGKVQRFMW